MRTVAIHIQVHLKKKLQQFAASYLDEPLHCIVPNAIFFLLEINKQIFKKKRPYEMSPIMAR